ncbi:MAG: CcoQ/FixQ family Cbb3-type cytochrome c oxidase assembly chaperone [Bacteroidales bacterium]|nr:CcoQ/FixQ family Cbb3-type cytochrome c oxidase assembly chaperone [Bacteroidales bacterium]
MKIVTNILENIADIQWFPIIGLIIFFLFFSVLLFRVFRMKSSEVDAASHLPLEDDDDVSIGDFR